jgi:L-amino acid N-acyltransferase YncA
VIISIRTARPEDAAGIARVHVDSWKRAYTGLIPQDFLDSLSYTDREGPWKHWLTHGLNGTYAWVAVTEQDEVVGFTTVGPERDADPLYHGELYSLYLLPSVQRQGIGSRLVQTGAHQLVALGLNSMIIWVLEDNPARLFYAASGGIHLEDHRKEITIGGATLFETAYGWKDLNSLPDIKQGEDRNP